ncbi:MAG: tRNA 4-thiouridine(8) synthase ThiI [Clostridium sp.]|jgi:thiamine biosynthesis protein ThiI|nr:tRNA 4-thiouridine(8) synthase ThiI [Clostridium sp.]
MEKVILIRYGEIMLKGLNRPSFEKKLVDNIKRAISNLGDANVRKVQGRIYVEPIDDNYDFDECINILTKVFGIVSVSVVWKMESDFNKIKENALKMATKLVEEKGHITFKVETKRGNKRFPMNSPEISRELGGYILSNISKLSVDVNKPSFVIYVEVREYTYIYSEIIPAVCGMPIGTNGKAMLLLSGGIDSPVAGWMIGKRGVEIEAVHFYSYPYTSERAKEKVIDLARILCEYCYKINLYVVPFTDIQLEINEKCPHEQSTIIMRRAMMKIAEKIAKKTGANALITGESIGQVASQTIESLAVTNESVDLPVFRPLIGMDKNEVVILAKKINTYETSILPYEDCCTVFVPKHPNTKPKLERIIMSEKKADLENLMKKAIEDTEMLTITRK